MTIICAHAREAGLLRIVAREGVLTLAGRFGESVAVAWDGGPELQVGAGAAFGGTLAIRAEIRLPPGDALFVLMPHQALAPGEVASPRIRLATAADPALDLLVAQAAGLVGRSLPPTLARICEAGLASLLAVAIEDGDGEKVRSENRELLYRQILLDIAANCRRHDYGVSQVAQRHKLNVRTLQKMFQQRGTTLKEHITASRLQLARSALLDPANAGKKVSDIAFESGFNDIATFNRLFRKSFGRPPSAFRTRAGGTGNEGTNRGAD